MKRWKVLTLVAFLCLNLLLCSFTFVSIYRKPENTSRIKDPSHGQENPEFKLKSTAAKLTHGATPAKVNQQPRGLQGYTATRLVPANHSTYREVVVPPRRPYFARRSEKMEVQALLLNFTLTPDRDHCDRINVRLLIAVCSSLDHFERREAIRATWGNATRLAALRIAIVFVIGLPQPNGEHLQTFLTQEHTAHGDVVQLNHVDHYRNLSLKSLGMLHWAVEHCAPSAAGARRDLLKTDDDVFLNAPYLMRYLDRSGYYSSAAAAGRRKFILGSIIQAAEPVRNRMSKWFTPENVFRGDVYPPYTSGTAYLVSADAVPELFAEGVNQSVFWLEDVFLTGIVARRLDVEMIHDARFRYRKTTRKRRDLCWYKTVFTEHDVSPVTLLRIWEFAGFDDEANDFLWTDCRNATENTEALNLPIDV